MHVDPKYVTGLVRAIDASVSQQQTLATELSSGLRVSRLGIDPVAASANVQLASTISGLDAFVKSAGNEQSLLQVTDGALGDVVAQVTSALTLAVSAGNGTLSPSDLTAIGTQLANLRDHVVSVANTSYEGSYLFSGTKSSTRPFVLDSTTSPATVNYQGDTLTQNIETPDGQKLQLNVPGSAVFTSASGDLLGALNQLVSDVQGGNTAAVAADTNALGAGLKSVTEQRSVIGSSLARLTATSGYAQTQSAVFQAAQGSLLSADPARVATDLKTSEVQYQALLSTVVGLEKVNLFDYIK